MHIPDGFLSIPVSLGSGALAAAGIGMVLRRLTQAENPPSAPLLGVTAAFVFAAQMLNFPVAAGTSGHFLGAVFASIVLGPLSAVVVMSAVIIIQCLMFADGGITALGANLFNMALVSPWVGHAVYRLGNRLRPSETGRWLTIACSAWASTLMASLACAGQLTLSGTVPASLVFPAMGGIHALIGIGEAVITVLVIKALGQTLGSEISSISPSAISRPVVAPSLVLPLIAGLLVFLSPLACPSPDGLEKVAADLDIAASTVEPAALFHSLAPDYRFPGVATESTSTILAGLTGLVAVYIFSILIVRRRKSDLITSAVRPSYPESE